MKCAWCEEEGVKTRGHSRLCIKHYRFSQMRMSAKQRGVAVPSYEWLEISVPENMICSVCGFEMTWLKELSPPSCITLQHDASGDMRFLCASCNGRHSRMEGDVFYTFPEGKKVCPGCKILLPLSSFGLNSKKGWAKKQTYCRECRSRMKKERKKEITK